MKILAIIPARGGSKGVPKKNIRSVAGRPLMCWTIEQAKHSTLIDRYVVSSEDEQIRSISNHWQCGAVIRPAKYACDNSPVSEAILHVLEVMPGYDYVVVLQPTSPLRTSRDIDACIHLTVTTDKPVVSITGVTEHPHLMCTLDDGKIKLFGEPKRRQDFPPAYRICGAVYASPVELFLERKSFFCEDTLGYVMPKERSLDIDDEGDLRVADEALSHSLYQMVM